MIYVKLGKNYVICNDSHNYTNYSITLNREITCNVIHKTDIYTELEFDIDDSNEGELNYIIQGDNTIIDCGVAKFINETKNNYITYGE